jgi:hypothetical protein
MRTIGGDVTIGVRCNPAGVVSLRREVHMSAICLGGDSAQVHLTSAGARPGRGAAAGSGQSRCCHRQQRR